MPQTQFTANAVCQTAPHVVLLQIILTIEAGLAESGRMACRERAHAMPRVGACHAGRGGRRPPGFLTQGWNSQSHAVRAPAVGQTGKGGLQGGPSEGTAAVKKCDVYKDQGFSRVFWRSWKPAEGNSPQLRFLPAAKPAEASTPDAQ